MWIIISALLYTADMEACQKVKIVFPSFLVLTPGLQVAEHCLSSHLDYYYLKKSDTSFSSKMLQKKKKDKFKNNHLIYNTINVYIWIFDHFYQKGHLCPEMLSSPSSGGGRQIRAPSLTDCCIPGVQRSVMADPFFKQLLGEVIIIKSL